MTREVWNKPVELQRGRARAAEGPRDPQESIRAVHEAYQRYLAQTQPQPGSPAQGLPAGGFGMQSPYQQFHPQPPMPSPVQMAGGGYGGQITPMHYPPGAHQQYGQYQQPAMTPQNNPQQLPPLPKPYLPYHNPYDNRGPDMGGGIDPKFKEEVMKVMSVDKNDFKDNPGMLGDFFDRKINPLLAYSRQLGPNRYWQEELTNKARELGITRNFDNFYPKDYPLEFRK